VLQPAHTLPLYACESPNVGSDATESAAEVGMAESKWDSDRDCSADDATDPQGPIRMEQRVMLWAHSKG
jgi:hypothetical protein